MPEGFFPAVESEGVSMLITVLYYKPPSSYLRPKGTDALDWHGTREIY